MPVKELLRSSTVEFFRQVFGCAPAHIVNAPGRLELIGNHTDYNEGLVMGIAIDRYISIGSVPRNDGRVELVSSAFPGKHSFFVNRLEKSPEAPWTDYVKGVLAQLQRRNIGFGGFSAALHGTIPMGAGMSSSAAIEVATALSVRQLYPYSLAAGQAAAPRAEKRSGGGLHDREKLEVAKLCQAAENKFVGVQSGLLDQICSLFGKASHAIEIDCQSLGVEYVPMQGEIAIVVCNTGVKHALVGGEYNQLRQWCEGAGRKLGVKSLRSAELPMLEAAKEKLSAREYECAMHVVGEIQRVVYGARSLRQNDLVQFGQYMFQSHDSSRKFFKNSTPELDLLVDLARELPGCLGSRLTGGGFGGATISLVEREAATGFMRQMAERYQARSGRQTEPILCRIVNGAG